MIMIGTILQIWAESCGKTGGQGASMFMKVPCTPSNSIGDIKVLEAQWVQLRIATYTHMPQPSKNCGTAMYRDGH